MKELFAAELRRFANAALVFAAAHLVLQLVVGRNMDVLQMRWQMHMIALAVFMVSGLALGLYQFGTYRHSGRWVWLLHRPVPRPALFAAIACASVLLIVLAVGLPALAALACTKWMTARVVDLRHVTLVAHLVLFTIIAWLAGACIMLSHSRTAVVVLVLPFVALGHLASGVVMLVPALACTALLACVAYGAFKPDRARPPVRPLMVCATALPLLLGFYLALALGGSLLFQSVEMAAGIHPANRHNKSVPGFYQLTGPNCLAAIDSALAVSGDPRAPQWRQELALRKAGEIHALYRQYPVRGQASNQDVLSWQDPERATLWTFSHDAMRFHGMDANTGEDRGWFGLHGAGDSAPFPEVPVLPRNVGWIMTSQHLYDIDFTAQTTRELIALQGNEKLAWPAKPMPGGKHYYTLTNERLLVHPINAKNDGGKLGIQYSIDLPGPFSDLGQIGIAELADGTLLSFVDGRAMMDGGPVSAQTVMFVDRTGKAQVVARRDLLHEFPALFEHRDWWVSPVLQAVVGVPELLLEKGYVLDRGQTHYTGNLRYPRPPLVVAAAVLCALLSALAAWRWLRPAALPAHARATWIAACLLFGLPGFLTLMALVPRRPRYAGAGAAAPAGVQDGHPVLATS